MRETGAQGYVGVGSNIEPARHVVGALELLQKQLEVTGSSTFYVTDPVARPEQPLYANGVFGIRTALGPGQVKQILCAVEVSLGRRRTADRPTGSGAGPITTPELHSHFLR